jgi:hypothetical protein
MIIKLPAKINMDNEILKISFFGKTVNCIPFSNIESISIKKTEKPITYWFFFALFYIFLTYIFYLTMEYEFFLILFPFAFILLFALFKNFHTNSLIIKEIGKMPNEHYIFQRDKTKIKIIISKIRMHINVRNIEKNKIN